MSTHLRPLLEPDALSSLALFLRVFNFTSAVLYSLSSESVYIKIKTIKYALI